MKSTQEPLPDCALHLRSPPLRPLVAVMPFLPSTDDPALKMLGAEIADVLRERLARDPAMQAILISSEFIAKAPPHALELICRELRVGHLISGNCHGTGATPSLYVELTDTREWHIRWANFYSGEARRLLAPDDESMQALVTTLRTALVDRGRR